MRKIMCGKKLLTIKAQHLNAKGPSRWRLVDESGYNYKVGTVDQIEKYIDEKIQIGQFKEVKK